MLTQMTPSADAIGHTECDASRAMARRIRDACGVYPCGDPHEGVRFRIGRLENESREISSEMDDVLARAACNLILRLTRMPSGVQREPKTNFSSRPPLTHVTVWTFPDAIE
jgi:hypothetical protein